MAKLDVVIPAVEVEVGGVKYRKVDRKAQAGDIVRVTAGRYLSVEKGAFYTVEDGAKHGNPGISSIVDDDGDFRWGKISNGDDWEVYENISDPPKPERLKVGEYAKVINMDQIGGSGLDSSVKLGGIYEILTDDRTETPYYARNVVSGERVWFKSKRLARATEAEVESYKKKAEGEAKWSAIGRKVNEFKAGDIVGIKRDQGGDKVGTIAEVVEVRSNLRYKSTTSPTGTFAACFSAVTLIVPVEQRFDTKEAS